MGRITKEMKPVHDMLEANGYSQLRSKGSHFIYGNGHNQITITKKPNKMMMQRLIKQNNLIIWNDDSIWIGGKFYEYFY